MRPIIGFYRDDRELPKAKLLTLIPMLIRYKLWRTFGWPKTLPINITISITNKCNSRCQTCFIWKLYEKNPELRTDELTIGDFSRVFQSLGTQVLWATLSGGEPYLRKDLPQICLELYKYCHPLIINIPTNGLLPKTVYENTEKILRSCKDTTVIINLSLDAMGNKHDFIRGVPGNYQRLFKTYKYLKKLKGSFPNLLVGIHTVISKFNIESVPELYDHIKRLRVDTYITEIAENRTELFNMNYKISPTREEYEKFVNWFSQQIPKDNSMLDDFFLKIIQAFRVVYYRIAVQEFREKRQIIPCYAGYASCQVTPYGDVWPCCTLGYNKPMGNLRSYNYNFKEVWFSKSAEEVREYIKRSVCSCPLANSHYTNILCSFKTLLRVILKYLQWSARVI